MQDYLNYRQRAPKRNWLAVGVLIFSALYIGAHLLSYWLS